MNDYTKNKATAAVAAALIEHFEEEHECIFQDNINERLLPAVCAVLGFSHELSAALSDEDIFEISSDVEKLLLERYSAAMSDIKNQLGDLAKAYIEACKDDDRSPLDTDNMERFNVNEWLSQFDLFIVGFFTQRSYEQGMASSFTVERGFERVRYHFEKGVKALME